MKDPFREKQIEELNTVELGVRILMNARNELYLNMHFLDISLSSLGFEAEPDSSGGISVSTAAAFSSNAGPGQAVASPGLGGLTGLSTDGYVIYYEPELLFRLYGRGRVYVNRAFLHMVFHCLFCHLDGRKDRDRYLWNLSCDIAVESMIDGICRKCVHIAPNAVRREFT